MELPNWKSSHDTARQEIIKKLEESSFDFYLTGSRFFGNSGIAADIDLFTQDSVEVEVFLKELGFIKLPQNFYNNQKLDVNTARVYRATLAQIDVQLVEKPHVKFNLQIWLKENNLVPPKLNANIWWNEKYSQFLIEKQ